MRILLFILMLAAPAILKAQVVIQSQKYYAAFKDEYRNDTAVYELPVISLGLSNDMIHKLSPYLSADSLLGENIDSVISNYKQYGAGLTGVSYNVLYNKNNALSISVFIETLGAYPDSYYQNVNLNLAAGNRIFISDIIKADKMTVLAKKLDKIVQQRIQRKIMETLKDNMEAEINSEISYIRKLFSDDEFTEENLSSFAIKEGGIMFYFNYGLPHVVQALSPDEDIFMSNTELSEFYTEYGKTLH